MRSLRGRLTLGVTAVLAAVLLVALVTVARYVERSDRQTLDARLQATARLSRATALDAVNSELPAADRRLDAVLRASQTSLRLVLADRRVLFQAGDVPAGAGAGRLAPRDGLQSVTLAGRPYRVLTERLDSASLGGLVRYEVTTGLGRFERRQRDLKRNLLALGAAALLVAAAATWLATSGLLRPLGRLRRLTGSIAGDEDLDRRIPVDDGPSELRALAVSFDGMLARLARSAADRERALAATQRFAADAGHELRTPLTSVQATLSALRRHPGLDPERRSQLLDDALGEQRRLVALLDGLQALARGDAAPFDEHPVDLADVVDQAAEAAAARFTDVRWQVHLPDDGVPVAGWEPGLRMLVDNLLVNAARHGRPGGTVRVGLDADGPVLVVEDDGPGVPVADRERVFEPFARVAGTAAPGSGLGLALVAQQAVHHGAGLTLDASPLGGARFRLDFGLARRDPRPSAGVRRDGPGH